MYSELVIFRNNDRLAVHLDIMPILDCLVWLMCGFATDHVILVRRMTIMERRFRTPTAGWRTRTARRRR